MIVREKYLEILRAYRGKRLIKVISGIRRCGKSTLLEMFQQELLKGGIERSRIISLNFEDMAFRRLLTADALYDHLEKLIAAEKMNYIFLDEIQMVTPG